MKVAEQIPPTYCSGRTSIHHPFSPYPVGANSPPGPWPYKADGFWQIIEPPVRIRLGPPSGTGQFVAGNRERPVQPSPRLSTMRTMAGTFADVAQLVEHRARRYAQVQVLPSAPWQGAFSGDTPLPLFVKYKLRPAKAARLRQLVLALDAPVQFRLGTGPSAPLNDVSQEGHSRHRYPVRGGHSE